MRVMSVWPGGWVDLPEFEEPEGPLVNPPPGRKKVHRLEACANGKGEGLRAVVLGLARSWERQAGGEAYGAGDRR